MRYTASVELHTSLAQVLRTKREYIEALDGMGIRTVEDLLLYLPRAYEDLSQISTINSATLNTKVSIRGTVEELKLIRTRTRKQLVKGTIVDTEGTQAEVVWFNQPHIKRMLSDGDEVVLTGKLVLNGRKVQLQSPQFESAGISSGDLLHAGRLVPVYPQHEIITSKWLREKVALLKDAIHTLPETLPDEVLKEESLLARTDAIAAMHFPDDSSQVEKALKRMEYEEMYRVQREALEKKREWQGEKQERLKIPMDSELIRSLFASLHFTPTNSQKIAIYEILYWLVVMLFEPYGSSRLAYHAENIFFWSVGVPVAAIVIYFLIRWASKKKQ